MLARTTLPPPNSTISYLLPRFSPPLEGLQRIAFPSTAANLEPLGLEFALLEALRPLLRLVQRHEPDLLRREGLLALLGKQIIGYVLQMRLCPCRPQLSVMPQVVQLCRVLLKMPLQLLALEKLLPQLPCPRLANCDFGDRSGAQAG